MKTPVEQALDLYGSLMRCVEKFSDINLKLIKATGDQIRAAQTYWNGVFKYLSDFTEPSWNAVGSFGSVEKEKLAQAPPWETFRDTPRYKLPLTSAIPTYYNINRTIIKLEKLLGRFQFGTMRNIVTQWKIDNEV